MKFTMPWGRKKVNLKTLTLEQLKSKFPKVVEGIRAEEREKLHSQIEQEKEKVKTNKQKIKDLEEGLKAHPQQITEAKQEEYSTLLAQKAKLILNEQTWQQKQLIKKKLKNMPSSLKAILEPVLFSCSSQEDMDREIEETLKLYQATHPGEPQAGIIEKRELTAKEIEEKKQQAISEAFDEAFS